MKPYKDMIDIEHLAYYYLVEAINILFSYIEST